MTTLSDILDLGPADAALANLEISGLRVDSRKVEPGDVFFALAGAKDDGLGYVAQAVAKGARVIVAERAPPASDAAFVQVADARLALAQAAARFYPRQPATIVAITGTSGKTSVAAFVRQIWLKLGHESASMGTIGVVSRPLNVYGSLTTPDPITLHETLDRLAEAGVTHLALEASSHGLDQKRLDGVRLVAGGFTNLSRDHMDYHATTEDYLAAKLRLFRALLPPGAAAVIDADSEIASHVADAARRAGLRPFTVGVKGEAIQLVSETREGFATRIEVVHKTRTYKILLPLPGDFQVSNALVAAGLCIACAGAPDKVFAALETLEGAPGRLERVGDKQGAPIFVDYAHKPDALEKTLAALRPFVRGRLVVVFGCGGDRDPGKRPMMGQIAARGADVVIVTDDNPRSESPATIRAAILGAAPNAREIGDRAEAIRVAIELLGPEDALVVAGKGHETGQIVGDRTLPFSDADSVRAALENFHMSAVLWTEAELTRVLGSTSAPLTRPVTGVSIDTRTLLPGDLFFAIKGEAHDGHEHVARASAAGAAAAVVIFARKSDLEAHGPIFADYDTLLSMERLGRAARARSHARIAAVTGSVGKTSAKEMLRLALSRIGPTHASAASYNNHWGVPLSLTRLSADAAFGVFEIGMNHAGEITPLVGLVCPHVALITTIAPVHIEYMGSIEAIADAKAEIFLGLEPGGTAVINRDAPQFERLEAQARARGLRTLTFGAGDGTDAHMLVFEPHEDGSFVRAEILGRQYEFALGAPGRHMAQNALGVLLVVDALGGSIEVAAAALADFAAPKGRGERFVLDAPNGAFTLIDESYNANPASMRAALSLLDASKPGPGGRRIAVIGDMLELGESGAAMHAELAPDLVSHHVDLLFGAGPLTRALFDAAPASMRAAWGERSTEIRDALIAALRGGDVVMVKGSNGSRMGPIVAALREHFSAATRI